MIKTTEKDLETSLGESTKSIILASVTQNISKHLQPYENIEGRLKELESWKKLGSAKPSRGNIKSWSETGSKDSKICGDGYVMVGLNANNSSDVLCATLEFYQP